MILKGQTVLVRVDGSRSIGLGHIYRMKTLSDALWRKGARIVWLSLDDEGTKRVCAGVPWQIVFFSPCEYDGELQRTIENLAPRLIILDVLNLEKEELMRLRERTTARVVLFDNTGSGFEVADVIINAIVFHWGVYERSSCRARLFEGPEYMVLHPEILKYSRKDKIVSEVSRKVLIAFGGTDTRGMAEKVLSGLACVNKQLDIIVNTGPGTKTLDGVLGDRKEVRYISAARSLFEEFDLADVVLCGGGNMLYELAAIGTPAIAIASEEHEKRNIAYWSRVGSVIDGGYYSDFDATGIGKKINSLLKSIERRERMSNAGRAVVDGCGADRVISVLEDIIE